MTERQWICTEPGVLALTGTDWRIVYEPQNLSEFAVRKGDRLHWRCGSLLQGKSFAEAAQAELEEIGMG